jgi:hypothetical protein
MLSLNEGPHAAAAQSAIPTRRRWWAPVNSSSAVAGEPELSTIVSRQEHPQGPRQGRERRARPRSAGDVPRQRGPPPADPAVIPIRLAPLGAGPRRRARGSCPEHRRLGEFSPGTSRCTRGPTATSTWCATASAPPDRNRTSTHLTFDRGDRSGGARRVPGPDAHPLFPGRRPVLLRRLPDQGRLEAAILPLQGGDIPGEEERGAGGSVAVRAPGALRPRSPRLEGPAGPPP